MIDTSSWKEFHLYDIFDINMGNKMDRGKMSDGTIAFVGRTANNNGINARVGKVVDHEKYGTVEPYEKGCITLALGGSIGSCFIQEEPFYTSQNVAVLISKTNQSDYALRFITSVITHSVLHGKYEAFTEELNKHIKTDFVISLPATSDGQPDWDYMESYMKAVMEESEKSLESLRKADNTKHLIDVSGWGEFKLSNLFTKKTMKGYPKKAESYEEVENGYHIYGQNIGWQYPYKVLMDEQYLHKV
ncbi:MAG: restriction endonuclease subunit S, partial [Agathobacter sp.]|nr:restriction endonuclease subunit S [Agathobacter sp.]